MIYKNLSELIGKWNGDIPDNLYSSIQIRSYKLYHKKIDNYAIDDIRFMTGQEFGLQHLVPMALIHLEKNLLVETMYYKGDLLKMVLLIPLTFWNKQKTLYKEIFNLLMLRKNTLSSSLKISSDTDKELIEAIEKFLQLEIK